MSEITVTPGRGLSVVVSGPWGAQDLALVAPDSVYARLDLICLSGGNLLDIAGTPMPPPLQAPECPAGAEVLAGVLVKPVYVATSDIIGPEKLLSA